MIHIPLALADLCVALGAASLAYIAFALLRLATFRLPEPAAGDALAPVSVLKPLHGLEPELEANLATFCDQDYPHFQVIFSVRDPGDPALEVARRLQARFPDREIEIVTSPGAQLPNPKIDNIAGAMNRVNGEIVVIADSDMRVDRQYLRGVVAPFADPHVGAVTAPFGARASGSLASRIGALLINDQFTPSVLVAGAFEPLRYCVGATMAVRRRVLDEIGGIEAIGHNIADDYMLGYLVSARGYLVALAGCIPITLMSEKTLRALWSRELRWARTVRAVRPLGFAGTIVTFPLPFAVLNLLFAPSLPLGIGLFVAALGLRFAVHLTAHRRLGIPGRPQPWLVPPRDALSLCIWVASFFGRDARWRSRDLRMEGDGSLGAIDHPHAPRL
ncbi:MAG TPA: bacteriohopanetetrol glucosamine biosynthesis glycosyltransferase HpnI [Candidatus Tyrphobacter sp.]